MSTPETDANLLEALLALPDNCLSIYDNPRRAEANEIVGDAANLITRLRSETAALTGNAQLMMAENDFLTRQREEAVEALNVQRLAIAETVLELADRGVIHQSDARIVSDAIKADLRFNNDARAKSSEGT